MSDRILAILPVVEGGVMPWNGWAQGMADQAGRWDVLLVDASEQPSAGYLDTIHAWWRTRPLGEHRMRLRSFAEELMSVSAEDYRLAYSQGDYRSMSFGGQVNRPPDFEAEYQGPTRQTFSAPWQRISRARQHGVELAVGWSSYAAVLMCDAEVIPGPGALAGLSAVDAEWVAARILEGTLPHGQYSTAPRRAVVADGVREEWDDDCPVLGTHLCLTLVRRSAMQRIGFETETAPGGLGWSLKAARPPEGITPVTLTIADVAVGQMGAAA